MRGGDGKEEKTGFQIDHLNKNIEDNLIKFTCKIHLHLLYLVQLPLTCKDDNRACVIPLPH